MTDIVMPQLSDSMEQGTIISWFRSTGDQVEVGEELLEIETDKSTAPYVAETSGTLEILAPVGTTVAVGEPIGRIGAASELARSVDENPASGSATRKPETQREVTPAPAALVEAGRSASVPQNGLGPSADRATPLARRVATVHNVDLENVLGTGPLGRITRSDVLTAAGIAAAPARTVPQAPSPAAARQAPAQPSNPVGSRRQELSRVQQLIARRMSEAKSTVPHFQVQTEADMGAALALREQLKAAAGENQAVPSINDLIVKAAAIALRSHPLANGSYKEAGFELHDVINIGVAVAANDALVVPTVFDADAKSLGAIAAETRRLASAVRDGSIAPHELEGGTFTVSNLGMFGMTAITPVINAPQAAILGVGALRSTLGRVDGEITDRTLLTLTLSCDHRILYGADAARFLAEIRDLLEAPLRFAL